MAVKKVVTYPHPLLKKISQVVAEDDTSIGQLIQDLVDTMIDAGHSVGIAAPQIGDMRRAVVVDVSNSKLGKKQKNHALLCMINPVIVEHKGQTIAREGCMSVPDYTGNVARFEEVVVQFTDAEGQRQVIRAEGFEAIAIQHEIDHLDGYLFLDRVSSLKTDLFRRKS